jgi:hypothetical protein
MCEFHFLIKQALLQEQFRKMKKVETKECTSARHKHSNSGYPKDKVPVEFFTKPNKSTTDLYSTCSFCRKSHNKIRDTRIQEFEDLQKIDPHFGVCCSDSHDALNVSEYPRNRVPITMFSKNLKGKSYDCNDCRIYQAETHGKRRNRKKEVAKNKNKFCCNRCINIFDEEDMARNLDGSISAACLICKPKINDGNKISTESRKQLKTRLKLEKFLESQCRCQRCKCIFLQLTEGTNYQIEIPTYEKEGVRYVNYEDVTYRSTDFLHQFRERLETRTIDFDHLPEEEQRARGILKPGDVYEEKKGKVFDMKNENEMRKEARKTQNICCKCHVFVTIEREKKTGTYTHLYKAKENYVNELRKKGCECCGFYDERILRYLEFDHLNPPDKMAIISDMIRMKQYSLEQLKDECKKCRILCRSCHRIHTNNQKKQGII